MPRARVGPRASFALVVVLALLLAGTAISGYARTQISDSDSFANRVESSLDDPDVRRVIADRIVGGLSQSVAPNALVVRPLAVSAVAALADTRPFRRLFARALRARHAQLVDGERGFALRLLVGGGTVLEALRSVSPRLADAIPRELTLPVLVLEPRNFERTAARWTGRVADWWWPLLAATLICAAACVLVAGSARDAIARLGIAVAGAGLVVAAVVAGFGSFVVSHVSHATSLTDEDERAALHAVWSALFEDLLDAGLIAAAGGLVVALVASGELAPQRIATVAGWLRDAVRSPRPAARLARALVLLLVGAALLLEPLTTLRIVALVAGVLALIAGAGQLAGRRSSAEARGQSTAEAGGPSSANARGQSTAEAGGPSSANARSQSTAEAGRPSSANARSQSTAEPRHSSTLALAGALLLVIAVTALAVALVLPGPNTTPALSAGPPGACNGLRALCGQRLDQALFPTTHNSYAAADEPGWYIPNQRFGIARQLRDGIRGLLIDVHYGVRDPRSGRVRTDLAYEGSSRNKVAKQLSPEALRLADRLGGRVGLGAVKGQRKVYLCHTLCELGAEPIGEQLGLIRAYLRDHPRVVLIVFVEPYVPARVVERAFDDAGLLPYTATLRRDRPLPTLGSLVRTGKRLIVFAEEDGGTPPFYLDGFSFVQDTPLGATRASEFSCRRFRGSPDSPLLLLNHWIDSFPPSPTRNASIGGPVLRARIRRCDRERGMLANLVAVDFYERTDVVGIAERLNRAG